MLAVPECTSSHIFLFFVVIIKTKKMKKISIIVILKVPIFI